MGGRGARWPRQQVALFCNTTVLVTAHGQGAANVAFVPPGGAMVLVMPPKYLGWRHLYVNIAVASGVHAYVYRRPGEMNPSEGLDGDWLGHGDFSSAHPLRDADVTVAPEGFAALLRNLKSEEGGDNMFIQGEPKPGPVNDESDAKVGGRELPPFDHFAPE